MINILYNHTVHFFAILASLSLPKFESWRLVTVGWPVFGSTPKPAPVMVAITGLGSFLKSSMKPVGMSSWEVAGFFFDSLNCSKVPRTAIFLRFRPVMTGLALAFSKCNVLPFFSAGGRRVR